MHIFTDVSVGGDGQIGVGCVAVVTDLSVIPFHIPLHYYYWTNTSSTRCELDTIQRALTDYGQTGVTVYTDCMQAVQVARKKRVQNKENLPLKQLMDQHQVRVVKLKGHVKKYTNPLQQIFRLVDQGSRRVMRREVATLNNTYCLVLRICYQVIEVSVDTIEVLSLDLELVEVLTFPWVIQD